jgi:HlyD family secretion protein
MIRVIIADDQPTIRFALQTHLKAFADIQIVGMAENGRQAIERVSQFLPDVLLLDLEMPVLDGLTATQELKERFPNTKVLVFTSNADPAALFPALRAGAQGYLLKTTPPEDLANAIRAVQKGHFQIGPGIMEPQMGQQPTPQLQATGAQRQLTSSQVAEKTITVAPAGTIVSKKKPDSSSLVPASSSTLAVRPGGAKSELAKTASFDRPVLLKSSPLWSRVIIWSIALCSIGGVTWASLAQIEEAIPATGQLEPQGAVKDVQSPVTGVVKTLYVKEGQRVKKGDLLLKLDPQGQKSELGALERIRKTLQAENQFYQFQTRLPKSQAYASAGIANVPPEMMSLADSRRSLVAENQLFYTQFQGGNGSGALTPEQKLRLQVGLQEEASRASATQSDAAQLQEQLLQASIELDSAQQSLSTNQSLLADITPLVAAGGIARIEQTKQAESVQKAQANVLRLRREQKRIQLAIAQADQKYTNTVSLSRKDLLDNVAVNEKRIAEIDSQFAKAIVDNERQIAELDNRLAQAKLTMQYQEVRAPGDGTIFEMKAKAPGFVTNASEPILKLVPTESLTAKVYVTNKDVGFIRPGMTVDVRVDSFPFSEYGDIKGKLTWIGSDALPPTEVRPFYSFPVKVQMDSQTLKTSGKSLKLQSGMSISVNIKTRKRSVISLFTEQFTNQVEGIKHLR